MQVIDVNLQGKTLVCEVTEGEPFYTNVYLAGVLGRTQADFEQTDETKDSFIKHKPVLADVALSGNYADLENKPFIAENVSELINDAGYISGISSGDVVSALGFTPLADTIKFAIDLNYAENSLHLKDQNGDDLGSSVSIKTFVPNILDFKWSDYLLNDQNWTRADTFSWQDGTVYSTAYDHLSADISGKTLQSETIGAVTVQFYLADDGHKICPASEESNVASIYTNTGVAWYYILDTANTRFKLPRINPVKEELLGTIAPVVGNGNTLGITNGTTEYGLSVYSALQPTTEIAKALGTNITRVGPTTNTAWGVSTDATKSGLIADLSGTTSIYKGHKYLYFYVGEFSQTATEQTAGLNAELFNSKADIDTPSIQAVYLKETYVNGTSGYRIWSDGYCEQWGETATDGDVTITFLKTFRDTTYSVSKINKLWNTNSMWNKGNSYNNKTASSVMLCAIGGGGWKVSGYLAEGEY